MNAYDNAFQNRQKLDADLAASKQSRAINDYKLKRQPVIDQQADSDRQLKLQDDEAARVAAADTAQRQAQLRGLMTLQTALKKGKTPQEAVQALGRGGMTAFGKDLAGMLDFATGVAKDPKLIDAQIAGLSGKGANKSVFKQDFAVGPDGKKGMVITYSDGTQEFTDYAEMPKSTARAAIKKGDDGNWYDPYTGDIISSQDLSGVTAINEADARGTALGKGVGEAQVDDQPWTNAQAREARQALSIASQKFQNFNTAIDQALEQTDWTSAGAAAHLKGLGGAPANLAATLNTVKANIGLDELLKLKAAGGTLGQVTTAEHELLQGLIADLSQTQDPKVMKQKLAYIKQQARNSWQRVTQAYQEAAEMRGSGQPDSNVVPDPQAAPTPKRSAQYYDN